MFDSLVNEKQLLRSDFSGIQKYGLTNNEAKLIFAYSYGAYDKLTKSVISGNYSKNPAYEKYNRQLQETLSKIPDSKGTLYRETKSRGETYKPGETIEWKAVASTSRKKDLGFSSESNLFFEIKASRGKDISNIAAYADEEETLLLPSQFKVDKVEGNRVYLTQL